jgi:hypothetical protein
MLVWAAGCTPIVQTKYITQELHIDPKPVLPKVTGEELQCLSKDVYQRLYDRQRLLIEDDLVCRAIIESTKPTGIKK